MRVLQVIHQFPPFSSQGSEVYCLQLSKSLLAAGDSVAVFHISSTKPRRPKRLEESCKDGIKIFHCIETGEYGRLAEWGNPYLKASFQQVLKTFKPDIVHFHNFLSLGDDLVGMAKTMATGIVYKLCDYGLICPNALLLRDGRELCEKNTPEFFEGCCPNLIRVSQGRKPLIASKLPPLARWRQFASNQPGKLRRQLILSAVGIAEELLGSPETTSVVEKKAFFMAATQRIFNSVDCFIAPSAFLRDRFVSCGLPEERILHIPNGIRHFTRVAPASNANDGRLQVGYIGAFHPHKGIDLLLAAFSGLGDRALLHLHGCSFETPVSEAHFQRSIADCMGGVVVHGRYENSEIASILSKLDVVVVPSRWYENSPHTIQEAQLAGVPVITADVGGMAELVRDKIDGRLFRCNDSNDLRRVLIDVIEHPDQLRLYRDHVPDVPCIMEQAKKVRAVYQGLL